MMKCEICDARLGDARPDLYRVNDGQPGRYRCGLCLTGGQRAKLHPDVLEAVKKAIRDYREE